MSIPNIQECPTVPLEHYGRIYQGYEFNTLDLANEFCLMYPEWGVLFGNDSTGYGVARCGDYGTLRRETHFIEVIFSDGRVVQTSFNGTPGEIIQYYIGKTFNFGDTEEHPEDLMLYGCNVSIDGIEYNTDTHRDMTEFGHQGNMNLIAARIKAREFIEGPRIGDFLLVEPSEVPEFDCWGASKNFKPGVPVYKRFTHDWDTSIQTTSHETQSGRDGSFHMGKNGGSSYSGGLDPSILKENLVLTIDTKPGMFWMFSNDYATGHNGISFMAPCRVYKLKKEV